MYSNLSIIKYEIYMEYLSEEIDDALVASKGVEAGVGEDLLLGADLAEGLDDVLGLLGDGPHDDLALVVVSAVLQAGDLLLKRFFNFE